MDRPRAWERAHVTRGQAQCQTQKRDAELDVVGEHAYGGTGVHVSACQVAVEPVDGHLVGVREGGG